MTIEHQQKKFITWPTEKCIVQLIVITIKVEK